MPGPPVSAPVLSVGSRHSSLHRNSCLPKLGMGQAQHLGQQQEQWGATLVAALSCQKETKTACAETWTLKLQRLASLDPTAPELVSQDRLMLISVFSLWVLSQPSEMAYCSPAGALDPNVDLSPCLHLRSCRLGQGPASSELYPPHQELGSEQTASILLPELILLSATSSKGTFVLLSRRPGCSLPAPQMSFHVPAKAQ